MNVILVSLLCFAIFDRRQLQRQTHEHPDKHRDRHTNTQTNTETDTHTPRQLQRQTHEHPDKHRDRHTHPDSYKDKHTNTQKNTETDTPTQTATKTDTRTPRQTQRQIHTPRQLQRQTHEHPDKHRDRWIREYHSFDPMSFAFDVDASDYIDALFSAVSVAFEEKDVEVSYKPYVVQFVSEGSIYNLMLPEGGLNSSVPDMSVLGNTSWWGDSEAFNIYCDLTIGEHSTYYAGTLGALGGEAINITIITNVTGFVMSTYKGFVQNGTTYSLPVHILDTKSKGNVTYTIEAPGASDQLLADTLAATKEIDLLVLRNNFLDFVTDYILSIMDGVDIDDYVTSS
uniref:Uncharacterized protein n=1 Tax=Timema cristinae TaxID=61476 RepID=A0A7R9GSF3_TIMCR|nr:unnamed protein product [Timema cristinae]